MSEEIKNLEKRLIINENVLEIVLSLVEQMFPPYLLEESLNLRDKWQAELDKLEEK